METHLLKYCLLWLNVGLRNIVKASDMLSDKIFDKSQAGESSLLKMHNSCLEQDKTPAIYIFRSYNYKASGPFLSFSRSILKGRIISLVKDLGKVFSHTREGVYKMNATESRISSFQLASSLGYNLDQIKLINC
jgi:hypothetical protein